MIDALRFECATCHEYRHGTIQPTLMAIPQRSTLLIAKIILVVLAAIVAVALSVVINYVIGLLFWGEAPNLGEDPLNQALPGYVAYAILYTVLGLALGLLFRGVPTALVILLVFPLVVQGLIVGLSNVPALDWLIPVVKFLPFTAGGLMMAMEPPDFGPVRRTTTSSAGGPPAGSSPSSSCSSSDWPGCYLRRDA